MDVQCNQINNNTGTDPPCACAHGGGGNIPGEKQSGGYNVGTSKYDTAHITLI